MTNKNQTIADWLGIPYCDHDWSGSETIMYGGRDIELSKCIGCGEYEGSVWEYPIDFETDGGFFVLLNALRAKGFKVDAHTYSGRGYARIFEPSDVVAYPPYNAADSDIKTALIEATVGLIERTSK